MSLEKMSAHRVVLASSNQGKLTELQVLLAGLGVEVVPQSLFHVVDAQETGSTFIENAIIKARHAAKVTGLPAIADDSGLEVDALNGQPGVYSARYSGRGATDAQNNQKLLMALKGVPEQERTARFHCVLVYMRHAEDPTPLVCHGRWEGVMLEAPRGAGGFGYDPLFWVPETQCGCAELPGEHKNRISHRAKASAQLLLKLTEQFKP